jgi:hypothetical protein
MKTRIKNNNESSFTALKKELYSQLILVGLAVLTSLIFMSILTIVE